MEIKQVTKDNRKLRNVSITVRTFGDYAKFMKDNEISPSLLFNTAIKELIDKKNEKKKSR